jgi:hypothetical protein
MIRQSQLDVRNRRVEVEERSSKRRTSATQRMNALRVRRAELDRMLRDEENRPQADPLVIHTLKRRKLMLKDELMLLEREFADVMSAALPRALRAQ